MFKISSLGIFISLFFAFFALGQQQYKMIEVGTANRLLDGISIETVPCKNALLNQNNANITAILANDFAFYTHLFKVLAKEGADVKIAPEGSYMDKLAKQNIQYVITAYCSEKELGMTELRLFSTKNKRLIQKIDVPLEDANIRRKVHEASHGFYREMTGKESFFLSRIVFVSDKESIRGKKTIKELYIADFDGYNTKRLTYHQGIVLSPAVSPDNKRILYSLIPESKIGVKNINLYEYNLDSNQTRIVSSRKGINSGAIYDKDGIGVYLTLTDQGRADIYYLNINTKHLRPVTNNGAADVDPSLSSSLNKLAFLSGRAGKAMVYTLDPTGTEKDVKRISYVGKFNATPRFSRDGKDIVFVSWLDGVFDLFRIHADGEGLVRLTRNFGSNEEPSFSPDGEFVIFTSKKNLGNNNIEQNVYIMNREGMIIGAITRNLGLCYSPHFTN